MAARVAHNAELDALLGAWTADRPAAEVTETLQAAGVPAGAALNLLEMFEDPHLAARGYFERVEHLVYGGVRANGLSWRFTRTPGHTGPCGTAIGGDNTYVFGDLLGLTPDQLAAAEAAGAVAGAPPRPDGKPTSVRPVGA